jgi:hypothetical protein
MTHLYSYSTIASHIEMFLLCGIFDESYELLIHSFR